jgi:hypothetical protein
MRLLTIADLDQPPEVVGQLVTHAMQLSRWWDDWKKQQKGSYAYKVDFFGEGSRDAGLHASEISGCMRKLVYGVKGTERAVLARDRDVNMQRRFDVGTLVHRHTQYELHEMCKWLGGRVRFEDEVHITPKLGGVAEYWQMQSHTDGVFTYLWENNPYLRVGLEIKTMSAKEFEKLTSPKEEHLEQTCMYMKALDLPLMWFIYYNKSNSNSTSSEAPYLIKFDHQLWNNKLEPRFQKAREMALANQLPAREEGRPCGWCPFAHTCQPACLRRGGNLHSSPPARF